MCNQTEPCAADGFKLFNTNLVLDRNGCVISRYRKFNLFLEPNMDVTKEPEIATFETDFGVTFGHFVCFDILFKSPAIDIINNNVSHILYPTMWFSEVPFLTSIQIQQSFAQRNNIVLLASGTNSPSNSNTGSGIFISSRGAVDAVISFKNESRMMIAEIPKDVNDPDYEPSAPSTDPYTPAEMDALKLLTFNPTKTFALHKHFVSTIGGVTCDFALNYTKLEMSDESVGYDYRLAVFSGTRSYANIVNAGEIHCAIIQCIDGNDEKTCGQRVSNSENLVPSVKFNSIEIKVSVDDDDENYLLMPTSLDTSIRPLSTEKYEFQHRTEGGEQYYAIRSGKELDNLMTFGIYGRNYNIDRKISHETVDESSSEEEEEELTEEDEEGGFFTDDDDDSDLRLKMTIYVVLMVVLSIVTAFMVYRKLQHPHVKPDLNKRKSCD